MLLLFHMKKFALIDKMMYQKDYLSILFFKWKISVKIKSYFIGIWGMLLFIMGMRKIQRMTWGILSFFDLSVVIKRNICMAIQIHVL